jgi:hypothetical protein
MHPGDAGDSFADIAALSPMDAWAVGTSSSGNAWWSEKLRPFIEHWDGKTWARVPAPTPRPPQGDSWDGFTAVAPISSRNAWVVGSDDSPATIEHWNGRVWRVVPNPAHPDVNASLEDVAGTGPDDVWAVGSGGKGRHINPINALIEHWDGSAWHIVPTPNVDRHARPTVSSELLSVAAISPTDAWAVGDNWAQPLVEHWNGSSWKPMKVPTDGRSDRLTEVDAVGRHDVWATGTSYRDVDGHGPIHGIIEHFNGSSWTITRIPGFAGGTVSGLSVQARGRVWVVGYLGIDLGEAVLISRLSKGRWHEQRVTSPKRLGVSAVDALPGGRVWLAGTAPAESSREAAIIETRCP